METAECVRQERQCEGLCKTERQFSASGVPVIRISQAIYKTIASEIIDKLDGRPYCELKIERDNGTYAWRYLIQLRAYYTVDQRPDGPAKAIKEVVPVWSEFHIWFSDEGDDLQNDFCAEQLRDHGISYNKPFTTTGVRTGTQCASPL